MQAISSKHSLLCTTICLMSCGADCRCNRSGRWWHLKRGDSPGLHGKGSRPSGGQIGTVGRVYEKAKVERWHGEKKGKPYSTQIEGDDLHRATGQWNTLHRVIDRENDIYEEVITDSDGNVVHERREPLSEHQGHGSAKR